MAPSVERPKRTGLDEVFSREKGNLEVLPRGSQAAGRALSGGDVVNIVEQGVRLLETCMTTSERIAEAIQKTRQEQEQTKRVEQHVMQEMVRLEEETKRFVVEQRVELSRIEKSYGQEIAKINADVKKHQDSNSLELSKARLEQEVHMRRFDQIQQAVHHELERYYQLWDHILSPHQEGIKPDPVLLNEINNIGNRVQDYILQRR